MVKPESQQLIAVCAACHTAACWYGEYMCNASHGAGIVLATRNQLQTLAVEHYSYWSDEKLDKVYGMTNLSEDMAARLIL